MAIGRLFMKRTLVLGAVLVTALILVGALVSGCGTAASPQAGSTASASSGTLLNVIVVSGEGSVTVAPDEAVLRISVENDGTTAAAALDANSKDTQKVLDRLKAEGVASKDIETTNVVVYPNRTYNPDTGRETTSGYRAQNTISVTFKDFELMSEVYAAATAAGADTIYGPSWQLSDDNSAVLKAMAEAVENARIKAEALAETQGVGLGDAVIITEGYVSVPGPVYTDRATAGEDAAVTPPPLSPQGIEVSASVTVTYPMDR